MLTSRGRGRNRTAISARSAPYMASRTTAWTLYQRETSHALNVWHHCRIISHKTLKHTKEKSSDGSHDRVEPQPFAAPGHLHQGAPPKKGWEDEARRRDNNPAPPPSRKRHNVTANSPTASPDPAGARRSSDERAGCGGRYKGARAPCIRPLSSRAAPLRGRSCV